jgi:glycosyltransferase involved in cell wall biosynthesis
MKSIKYICSYSIKEIEHENRKHVLSAVNKVDYICSALNKNNIAVQIVSPNWTKNNKGIFYGNDYTIDSLKRMTNFSTFGARHRIFRIIQCLWSFVQLFFFLIIHAKKNENIIVYHSSLYSIPILWAQKIKKFKIILEVEEIYQDVLNLPNYFKKIECEIIERAAKYIFSTQLLNEKINIANKPNTVIHGTYNVELDRGPKFNDGKIHVVYAGTFDPRKGGALAAAAAEYLSNNYHVHIIGFGSKDDTNMLLKKIDEISKITEATVSYDGLLSGEEYIQFLQKCDIGLSTQIPEAAYNESSFPSKILSYMANGLRVVSIRIKAIEMSAVGQAVYYYDEPNAEAIANAIISIDINEPYNSRELIRRLDEHFVKNIKKLLEG